MRHFMHRTHERERVSLSALASPRGTATLRPPHAAWAEELKQAIVQSMFRRVANQLTHFLARDAWECACVNRGKHVAPLKVPRHLGVHALSPLPRSR